MDGPEQLGGVIQFGLYNLDLDSGELFKAGLKIKLQIQPFKVLTALVENQGRMVTRAEIRRRIWPDENFGDFDHALNVAIGKLRTALGDPADNPRYIETLHGRGYRFIGEIRSRHHFSRSGRDESSKDSESIARKTARFKSPATPIRSLAVLPLVNVTGLEETEYFADGVTELLIESLSQLPRTRVMARSTVFRYKGKELDSRLVGRELNVDAVVMGRVLKRGDVVKLSIELVNVEDGSQLWACHYDRDLSEMFDMQEVVAKDICAQLRMRFTTKRRTHGRKAQAADKEAYQFYLMGRYHLARRSESSLQKSLSCFKSAIEHDPFYSHAYAGLAEAYLSAEYCSLIPPSIAFPESKRAVERALQLDEFSAEAYVALGLIRSGHEWNTAEGEKAFLRAIELNPNQPNAWHRYGIPHLTSLRRFDEAEVAVKRALETDPLSLVINAHLALILAYSKRFDEAEQQFLKTLDMDPNFAEGHCFFGQMYWWWAKPGKAKIQIQQALSLSQDNLRMRCIMAAINARTGQRHQAQAELDNLLRLAKKRYVCPAFLSVVYLGLGDLDQTFQLLEVAFQERSPILPVLNTRPDLDELRSDARFKRLFQSFL